MGPEDTDCSICLQRFVHPAQLPCGHVFCFLCIKGCAFHRRRCPICRRQFSIRFFDDPKLVLVDTTRTENGASVNDAVSTKLESVNPCPKSSATSSSPSTTNTSSLTGYTWFYEGFAGWWEYDERTSADLEDAFTRGDATCEITAAGHLYIIDFSTMSQRRKDHSGRKRRIKRDVVTSEKKGIAGIKLATIQTELNSIVPTGTMTSTCQTTGVTTCVTTSMAQAAGPSPLSDILADHTYARPSPAILTPAYAPRYRAISCRTSPAVQPSQYAAIPSSSSADGQSLSSPPIMSPATGASRAHSRGRSRSSRHLLSVLQPFGPTDSSATPVPTTDLTDASVVGVQPVAYTSSCTHHYSTRSSSHH